MLHGKSSHTCRHGRSNQSTSSSSTELRWLITRKYVVVGCIVEDSHTNPKQNENESSVLVYVIPNSKRCLCISSIPLSTGKNNPPDLKTEQFPCTCTVNCNLYNRSSIYIYIDGLETRHEFQWLGLKNEAKPAAFKSMRKIVCGTCMGYLGQMSHKNSNDNYI